MAEQPRWTLDDALHRARTAQRLAGKYSAQVEPRLSPGLTDRLRADRATLGDAAARKVSALFEQKGSTGRERGTAAEGHALVMAVRNAVARTAGAPAELKRAIGIGDNLRPTDTQGVVAGLRAIAAQAALLTACGVTADDVAAAAQLATDLLGADDRQGAARDARADTTEAHIDGQLRLEAAVDEISARGALAMRRDAVARGRFEWLISATGPSKEDEDLAGPEPAPVPAGPPA